MSVYRAVQAAGLLAGLLAAGCSATAGPEQTALTAGQPPAAVSGTYQLNDEEKALDCKKLTGRMQVRILQARDYDPRTAPSAVAQSFQKAAVMAGGSASQGADTDADNARDRAQLEAYNQRLAAMNCKTFNLDDELRPKAVTATPTPVGKSKDGVTVTVPLDKIGGGSTTKSK